MHAACCRDDPVRCRVPREVRPCRLPETATYPLSYLPIKQGPTVVQGPSERPGGRGEFESRVRGPLSRHLRSAFVEKGRVTSFRPRTPSLLVFAARHLNQVISKLRFYGSQDFVEVSRKYDFIEFWNHLASSK